MLGFFFIQILARYQIRCFLLLLSLRIFKECFYNFSLIRYGIEISVIDKINNQAFFGSVADT